MKRYVRAVKLTLLPIFLITIFWQTRFALLNRFAVYDYEIFFVYLSTLLFIALLACEFVLDPKWIIKSVRDKRWLNVGPLLLAASIAFSLWNPLDLIGLVYRIFTVVEMFFFAIWVERVVSWYGQERTFKILTAGLIPLVLLGLIQVVLGHTLNLKVLGEWDFSASFPGVATAWFFGVRFLRPYSVFAHPNLFSAVAGVFFIYWIFRLIQIDKTKRPLIHRFVLSLVVFFGVGVLVGFSRGVWFALAVAAIYAFLTFYRDVFVSVLKQRRLALLCFAAIILVVVVPYTSKLLNVDSLSFVRRWELTIVALRAFLEHPLFGVGLNQFVLHIDDYWRVSGVARFNQPVHNVFIQILVETGVVGFLGALVVFVRTIRFGWKHLSVWLRCAWVFVLVTAMMDHYWWTLQAGMLTLFLLLGMTLATIDAYHEKGE